MPVCCLRNLCNFASLNQCLIKKNKRYEHYSLFVIRCAVAGWLAGQIMRGGGFGLLWNIIIGIIGGFIGGWLMSLLHIQKAGLLWELIVAVIGAIVLLFVISLFKKK